MVSQFAHDRVTTGFWAQCDCGNMFELRGKAIKDVRPVARRHPQANKASPSIPKTPECHAGIVASPSPRWRQNHCSLMLTAVLAQGTPARNPFLHFFTEVPTTIRWTGRSLDR